MARRSARLSQSQHQTATGQSARKTPVSNKRLDSLLERDETPDVVQPSIDGVLSTPTACRGVREQLSQLSALKTPRTEPRPDRGEMHPKTVHQTTSKAPDSGLKLGFADISSSTINHQNTPSKIVSHRGDGPTASSNFEFRFGSDANLSAQARELMDTVREDAAKIKAQMAAEKAKQDKKDGEAEIMFGSPRKIAPAKGRAGRFSDVHMAQFKKMDSIANHPSAFRARPGFAAPTVQSLKRSPSKAGLDEVERPQTAGKSAVRRPSPRITTNGKPVRPLKPTVTRINTTENTSSAKRVRHSKDQDASASRSSNTSQPGISSLHSPTKASLARSAGVQSPMQPSAIPRLYNPKSAQSPATVNPAKSPLTSSPHKLSKSQSMQFKPLPALPVEKTSQEGLRRVQSVKSLNIAAKDGKFSSKLPTFAGLKSILRPGRKENPSPERPGTPKRPNSVTTVADSGKKVDFTPSVKSRYAVKLAAASPSPAKIRQDTPHKSTGPLGVSYDSAAYLVQHEADDDWEDEDSEVSYPALPISGDSMGPVVHTFSAKAQEQNRRESKEFKSIFTTLHPSTTNLTSINTNVNKVGPITHADKVFHSPRKSNANASPSTIRHVRDSASGLHVHELAELYQDSVKTVPHGISGKKRRLESIVENDKHGSDEDAKENRRISAIPSVPGGWNDTILDEDNEENQVDNEGARRGGKRARATLVPDEITGKQASPAKKPNAAREAAAKNAKERKGRGVLSLSRLNVLSRPKQHI